MLLFRSFKNKKKLKNIWLSRRETKISLKHKKIEEICEGAFSHNPTIQEIILPDTLKIIGSQSFCECSSLGKVILPEGLKDIEYNAFYYCHSLKEIELPDSIEHLGVSVFKNCKSLKKVKLPNNIKIIPIHSFENCRSLEEIVIPNGVKYIENEAFFHCSNLKYLELPSTIISIFNSFQYCNNLEKIVIKDWKILFSGTIYMEIPSSLKYVYINEETSEMVVSKNREDLDEYKEIDLNNFELDINENPENEWIKYVLYNYLYSDILKSNIMKNVINQFVRYNLKDYNYEFIQKEIINSKTFERMLKYLDKELLDEVTRKVRSFMDYELFKFAYALGAFSENEVERQRACEFIKNVFEKNILSICETHIYFESMEIKGFNKDFADFIMMKGNIEKLRELEKETHGYISAVYNSFEDIKEYARSNRGNQRYRKVTVDICEEFFSNVKFSGVNSSNSDIAETIHKYTHDQSSFDEAVAIRNEYLNLKETKQIDDNLLNEELKEVRKEIVVDVSSTLTNLNEISSNKFTYEYLSKYDSRNFVLGKYCSCCAHLNGVGKSIMKASILHPDCQNLVIKDENGEIVAKSTLYINRNQGYGVFNNVEVNVKMKASEKKKIYQKYIKAIEAFINRYNELNTSNKISQINVGMNLNDLEDIIRKNHKQSSRILKGIDFSKYGSYAGDWQKEQYIVWKKGK